MKTPAADNRIALIALGAVCFVLLIGIAGLMKGLSPSADVVARQKGIAVRLSDIAEGEQITVRFGGSPPMIVRHRTAAEIADAEAVDLSTLRDTTSRDIYGRRIGDASDLARRATPDGRFIALVGIGYHCVVIGDRAGEFDGWFDPCAGGHFDISGRIRKGPAVGNLPLPMFDFADANTLLLFLPDPKRVPPLLLEIQRP